MTSTFTALDSVIHRQHGWKRHGSYSYAKTDAYAPLLLAELARAIPIYPLAFIQQPDGRYQLVALQGIHADDNLLLDHKGLWQAPYIPSHYRAYPFTILEVEKDNKKLYMLGFNQSSSLYRENPDPQQHEERFYDDEGQLTSSMQQLVNFLGESTKNRLLTQRAVDTLAAVKLLEPWTLPINVLEGAPPLLSGLFRINPAALMGLPASVLEIMRNTQALDIAYAQIFSIPRLLDLCKRHAHKQAKSNPPLPLPPSLDTLFGERGNSGTMSFDWLNKK